MKAFKRNAVIITVVLFVCVAAYLNWSYSKDAENDETGNSAPVENVMPDSSESSVDAAQPDDEENTGLYYGGAVDQAGQFAEARIARQTARDAAVETLATVNATEGASQEIVDAALEKITAIAAFYQQEAELETLIKAKGFTDCVAFISEDGVKVTVPAPQTGLSAVDVAKITEIVTSETAFSAEQLNIIEVK